MAMGPHAVVGATDVPAAGLALGSVLASGNGDPAVVSGSQSPPASVLMTTSSRRSAGIARRMTASDWVPAVSLTRTGIGRLP